MERPHGEHLLQRARLLDDLAAGSLASEPRVQLLRLAHQLCNARLVAGVGELVAPADGRVWHHDGVTER